MALIAKEDYRDGPPRDLRVLPTSKVSRQALGSKTARS
eukprot:CAMPEP_0117686738 /NCGR_PEP_ID=MMETSP0804-20121206/22653_1 /TAXON_ID=1074897 /ORGANISM="Tetraselmis astigmatica, Strain CCMP880" /LENGTH=37 /DNA_ID= /DNA_START= /DNA_END= /DNA_ORIENTATION=